MKPDKDKKNSITAKLVLSFNGKEQEIALNTFNMSTFRHIKEPDNFNEYHEWLEEQEKLICDSMSKNGETTVIIF
jgi:hypothetical protein